MNILYIFVLLIIVYIVFTQRCILTSYQNIFVFDKISTFFTETLSDCQLVNRILFYNFQKHIVLKGLNLA